MSEKISLDSSEFINSFLYEKDSNFIMFVFVFCVFLF